MGERRFLTKNRFVSFLLAIAMVLTLLPIGAVQAKAEEATVKLYFELPQGTKVTDWGVNVWSNAKVTEGNLDQTIASQLLFPVNPESPASVNVFLISAALISIVFSALVYHFPAEGSKYASSCPSFAI